MALLERTVPRDTTLFTLLAAAQRLRAQMNQALERAGLTSSDYDCLARLRAGAWCNVNELDVRVLQQLAAKGLVGRISNEANASGLVRITQSGRDLLSDADCQIEVVRATFVAAFTASERNDLADLLARI